jgi:class 3 adenylate cyclase
MTIKSVFQHWFKRLKAVGALPDDSEEARLRKTTLILAATTYIAIGTVWGLGYIALGFTLPGLIPLSYGMISLLSLLYFARSRHFRVFRFTQLLFILLLPVLFQWSLGGYANGSAVVIWAFAAPMGALIFSGAREALRWFAAFAVMVVMSGFFDGLIAARAQPLPPALITGLFVVNILGVGASTYLLLVYFVRQRDAAQARSEQLLLNVLPRPIAERLKQNPEVIADQFGEVTVLFADVVDFTPRSAASQPGEVVRLLNQLFSAFDDLAERHGLEKIKTIGDAYMVAGGVPVPRADHAEAIAEMALDMLDMLQERHLAWGGGQPVQVRIGIGTGGPVIAAVIGKKKFIYDVWGDAVNTASRMESHGQGGMIQVTEDVYRRLHNHYDFKERGAIQVKGIGEMKTYFLLGKKDAASAD